MIKKLAVFALLFFSISIISISQETIVIKDAWVREVPPGSSVSAAYMTIVNNGGPDQLIAISSDGAKDVEIHTSIVDENDVSRMEMLDSLDIKSGQTVEFKPGGMHLMLIGLNESLIGKENVELKLEFKEAGEVVIQVPVKKDNNESHMHHH